MKCTVYVNVNGRGEMRTVGEVKEKEKKTRPAVQFLSNVVTHSKNGTFATPEQ